MDENDFRRRYGLVTILSFVAVGMIIVKLTYRPSEVELQQQQQLLPTPTVEVTPTASEEVRLDENYPLLELLPYKGNGFEADRYVAPKVLAIKVKGLDKILAAQEIAKWMEENGVEPASHDIQWE